ncbi:unnamed protein product [Penicillium camemberti]|uniref:Str. FM013 n=1 Tax=Penicillium camemberti (strain FM 013) TaxID=1429867 RepID=A0A0G4NSV6_PENC3|nr:unnamed protein product [Penicillium camemberti]
MPAAVSSYTRSCKASAKPLEKESSRPRYCRGTATLHMASAHIPVAATTIWHAERQKSDFDVRLAGVPRALAECVTECLAESKHNLGDAVHPTAVSV